MTAMTTTTRVSKWIAVAGCAAILLAAAGRMRPSRADDARTFITVGDSPASAGLDAAEHAAWSTICLLILNLDETLTRS